jgi:hypothetical protein
MFWLFNLGLNASGTTCLVSRRSQVRFLPVQFWTVAQLVEQRRLTPFVSPFSILYVRIRGIIFNHKDTKRTKIFSFFVWIREIISVIEILKSRLL